MKIALIITTTNRSSNGIGGHYYSLITTAEELAKRYTLEIIHIGVIESQALMKSNLNVKNIISKKFNVRTILKSLKYHIDMSNPTILHAFDVSAHFFSRLIAYKKKIPAFLTKCGGINPKIYFPYATNLILYSEENYLFFKKVNKFKNSRISVIPNRAKPFESDNNRIAKIVAKYNLNKFDFIFLKITRIENYYKKSLYQLLELLKRMEGESLKCCVLIIGKTEDVELKQKLLRNKNVFVVDAPEFIINAKTLIDIADCVLGTGRGFMEASSKGKIMLAPCKNMKYPTLVSNENFEEIKKYNFSERFINRQDLSDEDNINLILKELKSLPYSNCGEFAQHLFKKYFLIDTAIEKMEKLYERARPETKLHFCDIFLHFLFVKKNIYYN